MKFLRSFEKLINWLDLQFWLRCFKIASKVVEQSLRALFRFWRKNCLLAFPDFHSGGFELSPSIYPLLLLQLQSAHFQLKLVDLGSHLLETRTPRLQFRDVVSLLRWVSNLSPFRGFGKSSKGLKFFHQLVRRDHLLFQNWRF